MVTKRDVDCTSRTCSTALDGTIEAFLLPGVCRVGHFGPLGPMQEDDENRRGRHDSTCRRPLPLGAAGCRAPRLGQTVVTGPFGEEINRRYHSVASRGP